MRSAWYVARANCAIDGKRSRGRGRDRRDLQHWNAGWYFIDGPLYPGYSLGCRPARETARNHVLSSISLFGPPLRRSQVERSVIDVGTDICKLFDLDPKATMTAQ